MRVLIVHNFYAQPGGEDAVVEAERAALAARGHAVRLLARHSDELAAAPLRGAAETVFAVENPAAALVLRRTADEFRPDVVHLHNLFPRWGLAVLRTLKELALPTVQTLHNFRWLCAPATLLRDGADCRLCARGNFTSAVRYACMHESRAVSAAYALALATNRRVHLAERTVARFICVSQFVRDVYEASGFAPEKLVVKGHFVAAAPGAIGPGDGTVLYAGRLSAEKGLPVLLRALEALPDVTLAIAGDGPERPALEASLAGRSARVQFLGRLSREALQERLRTASVCAIPAIGSETFGLLALEALAAGCPVVTTDAGALPELIAHGQTGWVVPRNDPDALAARIRWLLDRPDIARELGRTGRERVARTHLVGPNLTELEAIYDAAMRSRS